jgi:uncharacterized protein DUF177 involved in 23S rRNA accumulation
MTATSNSAPEFSRPISTAKLSKTPATYPIVATEAERAALVQRFGLVSLDRLEAEVRLSRAGGDIRLEAEFAADLVQACIVTLEPVPDQIAEEFVLIYRPGIDEDEADRLALENPEDEIIEPLIGDSIDIGEAVAQQLSVAMDPYPRSVGAQSSAAAVKADLVEDDEAGAPMARRNPFDALAVLKKQS